jgi:hypothetical protein
MVQHSKYSTFSRALPANKIDNRQCTSQHLTIGQWCFEANTLDVPVDQCYFKANSTQHWWKGSLNHGRNLSVFLLALPTRWHLSHKSAQHTSGLDSHKVSVLVIVCLITMFINYLWKETTVKLLSYGLGLIIQVCCLFQITCGFSDNFRYWEREMLSRFL